MAGLQFEWLSTNTHLIMILCILSKFLSYAHEDCVTESNMYVKY